MTAERDRLIALAQAAVDAYEDRFESIRGNGNYLGPIDDEMKALAAALSQPHASAQEAAPPYEPCAICGDWLCPRAPHAPAPVQAAPTEPVAEVVMAMKPPKASPAWLPFKTIYASLEWLDAQPVGTKLYAAITSGSSATEVKGVEDAATEMAKHSRTDFIRGAQWASGGAKLTKRTYAQYDPSDTMRVYDNGVVDGWNEAVDALATPAPVAADTLRLRLQKQCSGWGAYWRASDSRGVELTKPQAIELLEDALGVEVEIKDNGCAPCDGTGMIGGERCPDCASPARAIPAQGAAPVPAEPVAWQPIETAPKDGNEFLAIWGRQGNVVQVVKWNYLHKFWQSKGEPIAGFSTNATAWHPLPAPPGIAGTAQSGDKP